MEEATRSPGGDQVAWRTKAWKSLKTCFRRGSQAKATTVEPVLQKKEPTHEPGPGTVSGRNASRSHPHRTQTRGPVTRTNRNQTATQLRATREPPGAQPQGEQEMALTTRAGAGCITKTAAGTVIQ